MLPPGWGQSQHNAVLRIGRSGNSHETGCVENGFSWHGFGRKSGATRRCSPWHSRSSSPTLLCFVISSLFRGGAGGVTSGSLERVRTLREVASDVDEDGDAYRAPAYNARSPIGPMTDVTLKLASVTCWEGGRSSALPIAENGQVPEGCPQVGCVLRHPPWADLAGAATPPDLLLRLASLRSSRRLPRVSADIGV